ncbi:MAG: T9SS type A sorting domain-containing protein [Ignavibacteriales bacterium]|nr:T9SS type A sorting domain-containing protein [Ignavibacteriales bacterium]
MRIDYLRKLYLVQRFYPAKTFFMIFFIMGNFYAQQSDFFPLKVGNSYLYKYYSEEAQMRMPFPDDSTLYNGSLQYKILSKSESDSMIVWKVQEIDTIFRTSNTNPNIYPIYVNQTFELFENKTGKHELTATDYCGIWTFPSVRVKLQTTRYVNTIALTFINTGFASPFLSYYSDSLFFKKDIGLIKYCGFTILNGGHPSQKQTNDYIELVSFTVGIEPNLPKKRANLILSNYPNPFNPATRIVFELPQKEHVAVKVYDILGKEIKTLFEGEKSAGEQTLTFYGAGLPSGIYICRLTSMTMSKSIKMLFLK